MEFNITNLPLVAALVVAAGIAVLNGFGVFSSCRTRSLFSYGAIALHIPMLALLFFAGAELDFVLLMFLVNTLIYTAMASIKYLIDRRNEKDEEEEGEV